MNSMQMNTTSPTVRTVRSQLAPFNVKLLTLPDGIERALRPVTVLDRFESSSRNFHPNGLFSTETFGRPGSEQRNRRFSFIDLKVPILHPIIFLSIVKMKALYGDIMAGKAYATWNKETRDFERSTPLEGETGYHFFISKIKEIQFPSTGSTQRDFSIKLIDKYKDQLTITKLLVIPAGLRDFEFDDQGKPSEDEMNTFYHKVISFSNIIPKDIINSAPETLDSTRYSLQVAVVELFQYIKSLLEGKKKLILGKWASRKIYNSTRNVISSSITNTSHMYGPLTVSYTQTVVGLYQYLKATLPLTTYALKNGFLTNVFPDPNSPAFVVDPKTLMGKRVPVKPDEFDKWMTDEGIEKMITNFGVDDLRHQPVKVGGDYIGLIYKGKGTYMLLNSIDELPNHLSKTDVSPITFAELMYLSVYDRANGLPCFVTRYPITGLGSIYPSFIYLKSTVSSEVREELDHYGNPTGKIAYQFPKTGVSFMNTIAPHPSHLKRLGADFDGDTASFTVAMTDEAIAEVFNLLHSARYYVNVDGKMTYSISDDISDLVIASMTG